MSSPDPQGIVLADGLPAIGPVVLGGNRFGSALDRDTSFALLDRYRELGGTCIDTALVYADWVPGVGRGCSERTVGAWLASRGVGGEVVVTTKGGHPTIGGSGAPRLDPASLREDATRSLEHLGLPQLPLWWLHRDDPTVPVTEILDAVEDLRSEGLVRSWGVSNWTAARLEDLLDAAAGRGVTGPVANSSALAVVANAPDTLAPGVVAMGPELHRLHTRRGLPLVAFSAQAKGWLDKVLAGRPGDADRLYDHGHNRDVARRMADAGSTIGLSATETALRAVLLQPFPVVAVVGPGTSEQLESCWRAVGTAVSDDLRGLLVRAVFDAVQDAPRPVPTSVAG